MDTFSDSALAVGLLNILLPGLLFIIALAIAGLRNLFAIVMLSGLYSLISTAWFVAVDAVDVAFTEAAVGAGLSTMLFLSAIVLTARTAKAHKAAVRLGPLFAVCVAGAILGYAVIDLPGFGDGQSAANVGVGLDYLERTKREIAIPNVVTAILASYRGFDTLGEVVVVYGAGLGVALLLGFGERSLGAQMSTGDYRPAASNGRGKTPRKGQTDSGAG